MELRPASARPSSRSVAPGLATGGNPEPDLPLDPPDRVELQAQPEKDRERLLKRVGLGVMGALTLAGGLAGVGGLAARNLPVCQQTTSSVSFEQGLPCVSAEVSTTVDGVLRVARGRLHHQEAVDDLASTGNRVLSPAQARPAASDGKLTVVSWNLHHGASPNRDGARDQMDTIVDTMNEQNADVFLLQEVTPWHAQELVDATGMVGYYSQTTPRQGNMILVDAGLQVSGDHRTTLNHQVAPGDTAHSAELVNLTGGLEPRSAQAVRLEGPDSDGPVTVFNTHLSTGSASPQDRYEEGLALDAFVQEIARPQEALIGGGDMNQRSDSEVVERFRRQEFQVEGATIDWLVSKNKDSVEVASGDITTSSGARVSDHPLVRGEYS